MAEGDCALPFPRLVVSVVVTKRVHLKSPLHFVFEGFVQAPVLDLVPGQVEEVSEKRPSALLQVVLYAAASCVPVDRLEHRHGYRQNLSDSWTAWTMSLISSTEPWTSSSSVAALVSCSFATCGSMPPLFLTNMAMVFRALTAWL